ncbi:hypothetical protein [Desulfovibrio sp. UCD-KL4C]|uniref:hypothetical protein n=1 Tax=Desulfovibrio sp. UCD-KL4C TaxID=2578120 RepID=UPI0025C20C75|nr:hypothetical protein [Desulfovibrio sp. UCD-KL4C]
MSTNSSEQKNKCNDASNKLVERLEECKNSGDSKGRAEVLFDMAHLRIAENNQEEALLLMIEAYSLAKEFGELSCLCPIGELLGQLLYVAGSREEGLNIVRESYAGFKEIGEDDKAANIENLLDAMDAHALANPLPVTGAE